MAFGRNRPGLGDTSAFVPVGLISRYLGVNGTDFLELTVIIPVYNAGSLIKDSLITLCSYLESTGLSYEVIVVNDGSTDETSRYIGQVNHNRIRLLTLSNNQGKGAAIKTGIKFASGRYIVTTDVDIPYGLKSIVQCHEALQQGALLAIGDRTLPESRPSAPVPFARRLLSAIYSMLVKVLLYHFDIQDTQCGLKGFQSDFAKELLVYSKVNRFAFDLEIVVFATDNCIPIARLPVVLVRNETSSLRMLADPLNMLYDFLQIVWNKKRRHYHIISAGQGCGQS